MHPDCGCTGVAGLATIMKSILFERFVPADVRNAIGRERKTDSGNGLPCEERECLEKIVVQLLVIARSLGPEFQYKLMLVADQLVEFLEE
jgi:hypothetical protein